MLKLLENRLSNSYSPIYFGIDCWSVEFTKAYHTPYLFRDDDLSDMIEYV